VSALAFSTPIYSTKLEKWENVQKSIKQHIDEMNFEMIPEWGQTHYLSPNNFKSDVIEKYHLGTLCGEIDHHLRLYCSELNFNPRDANCTSYELKSWFTKFEKGNYAHVHNHPGSDISGCYYFKTNSKDGNIFFQSPNPYLNTTRCYMSLGNTINYTPEEGTLLLFPSWLNHGVKTNTTDDTRISLSFNVFFK